MPKKFKGENSKAVVARARKADKEAHEKALREKAAEDAYWKEDDKHICRKLQRKEEKERKKISEQQRKQENKLLEEMESLELEPKVAPQKLSAYQIRKEKEEREQKLAKAKAKDENVQFDVSMEENLNHLNVETISASGIDAAVAALSGNDSTSTPDRHPEKRMAAAFRAFETSRLPQLKKDNPNMRLSQLKQLLRKEWQKSPQNPLNQRE